MESLKSRLDFTGDKIVTAKFKMVLRRFNLQFLKMQSAVRKYETVLGRS